MRKTNRFYRGEPLTATRLNDLVEAANRSDSFAPAASGFGRRTASATIKNESGAVVPRFGTLEVAGFWRPAATRDEAVARFAASGIELAGTTPTGSGDAFLVVALEPIPPGEFGPVAFASGGAFLAEVVGLDGADGANRGFATGGANAGSFVAAESGPFRIVARSASGVCLLAPVVEASDPFVFEYVERQPSYVTGSWISNETWRNERTPNGLKCYLCYCDLYDDGNAPLDALFAKKLRWDVTATDWTGICLNGIPYEYYKEGASTVLTPVCCGIRATILSGSIYEAEDVRTWSYRNGFAEKPPLTGRAFFPYPITLEFALSWNDAEDERRFFKPYQCVFSDVYDPPYFRCVLDHPRRHFESLDDVSDVFFQPGLRSARARLLCPVCYVPSQAEYIYDFVTIYETDDAFRFALESRPFKKAPADRYAERYWEAAGSPPDPGYSAVAIGVKSMRFTEGFSSASGTPSAPGGFAVSVDGATATFSWRTRSYAAEYALQVENLAGKIVFAGITTSTAAIWTAKESGDYVARLAAVNAAGARSPETSVAFSVVVPANE